ncbi:hypothetical protein [Streptomyces spirodelae]|uniref:Uncharacterized protein n=1 Tax=Streptomyces spirodelae TaxID=2812904 RepID=A0ABS3WTC2_9ACTN|nr:hypothetical protein [Streptomyces spirodelae]MBO8186371.1 hypothetical protein [Streptomyces spirodelae]
MQPLDQPGYVRSIVEARDPQLAERTAYQLAVLTSGSEPTEPEPTSDGTYSVWSYATRSRNQAAGIPG